MTSVSTIIKMLPAWKEAFMVYPVIKWGRQWAPEKGKLPAGRVQFEDRRAQGESLKDKDLIEHFRADPAFSKKFLPRSSGGGQIDVIWGAFGMSLRQSQGIVKYMAWDCDKVEDVQLWHDKVKPQLLNWEVDYIEEYSGEDNNKAHFWIRLDAMEIKYSTALFNQIRDNSGVEDKDWFNEQYPYGARTNALFRIPFGKYLKTMEVKLGNLNGVDFESAEEGMEVFSHTCKPLTEEKLLTLLNATPRERKQYVAPEVVFLEGRHDLMVPEGLPDFPKKLASQCQAINYAIKNPQLLNDKTGLGHDMGLYLSSLCRANDQMNNSNEGLEWFEKFVDKGRESDPSGHNWKYYWDSRKGTRIASCETWSNLLGKCEGCPFKTKIKGPRQLYTAEELNKVKVGEIRTGSLEEIRAEIFPQVRTLIDNLVKTEQSAVVLLESATNTGKSYLADQVAVGLAKQNKSVVIACNSTKVALEHKDRIEWLDTETKLQPTGVKAFFMGSYEAIFEHFSNDIVCPNTEAILDCRKLGIDSSYYKTKYCKTCPFLEDCNYPAQYTNVQDAKHRVVIIQHAHFGSNEVVKNLFRKHFDVMIVDEDFTDQLTTQLIPTAKEIEILDAFKEAVNWVPELLNWMGDGGYPSSMIKPSREHLKPIMEAFRKELQPYRLDQFLRQYNNGEYLHPSTGVMKFNPLPNVPITILTDATPTIEELSIMLNTKNIIRIGKGIVCDPKAYHPDNKVCQILDGRTSKAEMIKNEKLYEYLEYIGDKMMNDHPDDTALITVFKEAEQDTWDWLIRNYPTIVPRICVNHMAVGTNEFAKYNIQFVLAGPYLNTRMFKEAVYKLKFAMNYWRRLEDKPPINNPYPSEVGPLSKGDGYYTEPVRRNHRDGIYIYPQYQVVTPDPESYDYLVWSKMQGKKAQAVRIRQKLGKKSITYIFDNGPMDNFLIDEVFCENDVLGYIRQEYIRQE